MSKVFGIILIYLSAFLIVINLYTMMTYDVGYLGFDDGSIIQSNKEHFIGFRQFFDYLSTFPGLITTTSVITVLGDIVGKFNVTSIPVIDGIIAFFRVISLPIAAGTALIVDVVHNIIWFFQALTLENF